MLTGPLYMLQVYDRVLGSRSEATLLALTALVVFLYGMMGVLDYARGRVMARVAARFQAALDMRVFDAVIRRSSVKMDELAATGLKDLEAVQRFMASPVLMALFDLPWTPLFIAGIFVFHPWLGFLAIAGGVVLVIITIANPDAEPRTDAEIQPRGAGRRADLGADPARRRDGAGHGDARGRVSPLGPCPLGGAERPDLDQ